MDRLTDDELKAELRRATLLGQLADAAGEADASSLYASVVRTIDVELRERGIA